MSVQITEEVSDTPPWWNGSRVSGDAPSTLEWAAGFVLLALGGGLGVVLGAFAVGVVALVLWLLRG